MNEKIAVIGLGYVGLPLALALARTHGHVVGFDLNTRKLDSLRKGIDPNGETETQELTSSTLKLTSSVDDLKGSTFYIVCVPTPVDKQNRPDFSPLIGASTIIGKTLSKGAIAVFESTVYPGVTEDVCGPVIEKVSGLKRGVDFKLGYSPERINPGDKERTVQKILKIVSAEDAESLKRVSAVYGKTITAGIYEASSIKVAEAAKVIENTQRDVNIALMNELSLIFERMGIRTLDVLEAAGTKWNFLAFRPGLVGGHCIGVDPYYLTAKAEELGYHPQMILAGRRINDGMGAFVAQKTIKMIAQSGNFSGKARIGILGLTFKENVSDIRNSKVPDIINELNSFGIKPLIYDPFASDEEAHHEYGVHLNPASDLHDLDAVIYAVAHKQFLSMGAKQIASFLKPGGVFVDVKSSFKATDVPTGIKYWSL